MRSIRSKTPKQSAPTAPETLRRARRFEWPLLLYPASFVLALVALYLAGRSIERQVPTSPATQQESTASHHNDPSVPRAASVETGGGEANAESRMGADRTPASDPTDSLHKQQNEIDRIAVSGRSPATVDIDNLQGPDRTVAMLRMVLGEKDHTKIKQCMEDLVVLGDAAVVGLNDLMNSGGEAGLWAAEALARIGTPMATSALLDTLAQTKEGTYKEELGRRLSAITNHDSWPLLLDAMTQTGDATVARAASVSLARMADTPVLDEIAARYEAAATEIEIERLAQLVRNIQSPAATKGLLSMAGSITSTPQDSLQQAAVDALANVGDAQCLSHLIQRLEATSPGEGSTVYNAITRVSNPEAYSQLLYAAAGNKEVSAEYGRTAAIEALKNYPGEETVALLERIVAQESNEKVVTAASRTLDDIRRAPHVITASAESLRKSEDMLPLKSVTK